MKLWYIHHYGGGPGLGLYDRPFQLAKSWQKQGHEATIFIASFHHLLEQPESLPPKFMVEDVQYIGVPARPYGGNGLGRILNMWDFTAGLLWAPRKFSLSPPDVIIASSPHPFAIFSAWKLARQFRAKLVFEIRDIWPLSISEIVGLKAWHPFVLVCRLTEWFAITRSHLVSSVLPRADRYLADSGYPGKKFVWVPNGIDSGEARRKSALVKSEAGRTAADKLEKWRAEGRVIVIYTGSIGMPNAIDLLVKAVEFGGQKNEADRCSVLIVGSGEQLDMLKSYTADRNITNLHFSGRLPKDETLDLMRSADIGYAGLRNIDKLFRYGVSPNKVSEYLYAGLPVLLPISACGDPVSESGAGIARRADSPEELWQALFELIMLSPEKRREIGSMGRDYIVKMYNYDTIAQRYLQAINLQSPT